MRFFTISSLFFCLFFSFFAQAKEGQESLDFTKVLVTTGVLVESEDDPRPSQSYGVKYYTDLAPRLGYKLGLNFSSEVGFFNHQLEIRSSHQPYQFLGGIGLGQRIGIKNKDNTRFDNGSEAFLEVYTGSHIKLHSDLFLEIKVGANVGKSLTPNFSILGTKKVGEHFQIGGFFETRSSKSLLDINKEDRRYMTGGIVIGF